MKKLTFYGLFTFVLSFAVVSCMQIDNFDSPSARIFGSIIDDETGEPFQTSQGHGSIRFWEVSYKENPTAQNIPLMQGATYNNNKWFPGTYDAFPQGPWWPVDTVEIKIGNKETRHDFRLIPYLRLIDFTAETEEYPEAEFDSVVLSCRIVAPYATSPYEKDFNGDGAIDVLPQIRTIRSFLNINKFCGPGNNLGYYDNFDIVKRPTNFGSGVLALDPAGDGKTTNVLSVKLAIKPGYRYTARMGAQLMATWEDYNLTEIKEIQTPNR